ncbi:flagellar filament capping protein FliD [Dyella psychrodurans]|uniref:Flagellar hook-associated protein 2 n=1 Tax=Dyella psychrodurans TaxID=1927960 RepID=A0A370X0C0_9GAMM|nr:flagellar filament capping protein FliD [Dyella psychrodurans]RDS81858.1 flagellar capping protein [Dyella psychrodurans]
MSSTISSVGTSASALTSSTTGSTTTSSTSGSSSSSSVGNISGTGLLSSLGLGSGLDVNSIITALVNAQEAGPQAQITNQTNQDNNQIAGLTALQTALSGIQSALSELTSSTTYSTYNASLSNTSLGTVSTLPDATGGSYNIDVTQLATAQKRISPAQSSTATVGSGTLNITVGSNTLNVSVSSTDTLSSIASSINNASNNPGVSATVVSGVNGNQLVLTSTSTGTANGFTITAGSGSSSGLSSLATELNTPGSSEAANAELTIDGIAVTSASNNVTGALTGVTLSLTSTGTSQLNVTQSTTPITTAVNDFVTAYNQYASTVNQLDSYDASTGEAGVLLGDPTLAALQTQLSNVLGSTVHGNSIGNLASLGITRNADGTMALNSQTLSTALTNSPSTVQNLFDSTNGIANQLNSLVTNFNSSTGVLQTRINSLNTNLTNQSSQQTALNARMAVYQQQLVKQYTALDTLMTSLNNTSSYLTQSLAALNGTSSSSSSKG